MTTAQAINKNPFGMIQQNVTLYRIEDPETGVGPYCSGTELGWQMGTAHSKYGGRDRPSITRDIYRLDTTADEWRRLHFEYIRTEKGLSACPSLAELRWWFWGYIGKMKEAGFMLYEIKVSKALMGHSGRQIFFRREDEIERKALWRKQTPKSTFTKTK